METEQLKEWWQNREPIISSGSYGVKHYKWGFVQDLNPRPLLLEWRSVVFACFQGASLQFTNDIDTHLVQLKMQDINPKS